MSFFKKLKSKISNVFNKIFRKTKPIRISNNSNVRVYKPKESKHNFFRPYIPKKITSKSTIELQHKTHTLYNKAVKNKLNKKQWKQLHQIDIELKRRSYKNETDLTLKRTRKFILEQAVGNFKGSSFKGDKQQYSNMSYAKNGTISMSYSDYVYAELGIKHDKNKLTEQEKEEIRENIAKWQPLKQGAQYGYILVEEGKVNSPVDIDAWNV